MCMHENVYTVHIGGVNKFWTMVYTSIFFLPNLMYKSIEVNKSIDWLIKIKVHWLLSKNCHLLWESPAKLMCSPYAQCVGARLVTPWTRRLFSVHQEIAESQLCTSFRYAFQPQRSLRTIDSFLRLISYSEVHDRDGKLKYMRKVIYRRKDLTVRNDLCGRKAYQK